MARNRPVEIPARHPFRDRLNDIRFRRFEIVTIDDDHAVLTRYNGRRRRVTVPDRMNGYRITELGPGVFNFNTRVRYIRIKNGPHLLMRDAFEDCAQLRGIRIPASLREIDGQPFAGCTALRKIVIDPGNTGLYLENGMLVERKNGRLVYCTDRDSTLILIPEDVRVISSYAFENCGQLQNVLIPVTLEGAGRDAFTGTGVNYGGRYLDDE